MWKFYQIYNFGALGDSCELIRFLGPKVKVKVMTRSDMIKKQRHTHRWLSIELCLVNGNNYTVNSLCRV